MKRSSQSLIVLALLLARPLAAQQTQPDSPPATRLCASATADRVSDLSGPVEERLRLAEISGGIRARSRGLFRPSDALDPCGLGTRDVPQPQLQAAPIGLRSVSNSGYPEDRNDGGLWSGRGLSAELSGGVRASYGPLSVGLLPALRYSQNRDFEHPVVDRPGFSRYANAFYNDIDLPQRFGDGALTAVSPGQSYARIDVYGVAAGVSTENVWLGPAIRNPILLSNSAEGFPHAFVRSAHPIDARIALVDVSVLLGSVQESDWYDARDDNDDGRIGAWTVALRPRGLETLELGVGRTWRYDPDHAPDGLFAPWGIGVRGEPGLGMLSLFGRFLLPASDAEVYFEWARTERFRSLVDDLITEPEHSQAFIAGFQKISTSWIPVRIAAELAHLQEKQREREGRDLPIYYTHPVIRQGHTHRGQLLGAAIGPGADAQYVEADFLFDGGFVGLYAERLRRNDASQAAVTTRFDTYLHDTQFTTGVRASLSARDFLVSGSAGYSYRVQRDFFADDRNFRLTLEMSWWPGI